MSLQKMNKPPPYPVEILVEHINRHDIKISHLARALDIARSALYEILRGKHLYGMETAYKLSRVFNTDIEYWATLLDNWKRWEAKKSIDLEQITQLVP